MKECKKFRNWATSGREGYRYIPEEFDDFHDQKDLFKEIWGEYKHDNFPTGLTWVGAHTFVIDIFLWHMARKGYKLQKIKGKKFAAIPDRDEGTGK